MVRARVLRPVVAVGILLLLAGRSLLAIQATELADPRPASRVLDATARLDQETHAVLDAIALQPSARGRGELMVALVPSVGAVEPRRFATELFNAWRVGSAERNDGVLVFVAWEERAVEIVLGAGIDDAGHREVAQQILAEEFLPALRRGDLAGGLRAAAEASVDRLLGSGAEAAASPVPSVSDSSAPGSSSLSSGSAASSRTPEATPGRGWLGWVSLAVAGLGGSLWGYRRWLHRLRHCNRCGARWHRLSEDEEDDHLEPRARTEEKISSVDYDVWVCSRCANVGVRRYPVFFSGFGQCPQCRGKTLHSETTTLRDATTVSTGLEQVVQQCRHCDFRDERRVVTPRDRPDSDSYSSSDSSSSTGSGGSSSSGGGGISSGGGASGRW